MMVVRSWEVGTFDHSLSCGQTSSAIWEYEMKISKVSLLSKIIVTVRGSSANKQIMKDSI